MVTLLFLLACGLFIAGYITGACMADSKHADECARCQELRKRIA